MDYELLIKAFGMWQVKGYGTKEELAAKAIKWQECGYKTKLRKA